MLATGHAIEIRTWICKTHSSNTGATKTNAHGDITAHQNQNESCDRCQKREMRRKRKHEAGKDFELKDVKIQIRVNRPRGQLRNERGERLNQNANVDEDEEKGGSLPKRAERERKSSCST